MNNKFPISFSKKFLFPLLTVLIICIPGQSISGQAGSPVAESDFQWAHATPESQGMSLLKLDSMRITLAAKGTKKLLIIKNDKIVYEWFATGWNDDERTHSTASLAKAAVAGMSLLAAMDDGYIHLDAPACNYITQWKKHGVKSKITIRHLATHSSGIEDSEATPEVSKMMEAKSLDRHMGIPGWKGQFWRQEPDPFTVSRDSAPVLFTPGDKYAYSNPGIGMLTYAVTASIKESGFNDIRSYLKARIYDPIGISQKDYVIGYGKTFNIDGLGLVGSWGGGNFTARGIARIGRLMLNKGNWEGRQLIDPANVEKVIRYAGTALPAQDSRGRIMDTNTRTVTNPEPASTSGWYSNFDGVWGNVPRDAFAGGGAGNQHLLVVPSLDLIVVRMGANLYDEKKGEGFWLGAEKYLFNPVMDAIIEPPYPESDISIVFSPKESVIRMAYGGDIWASTWGDDNNLYTAYGDGNGFPPATDIKLSLGLVLVSGDPPSIRGVNIRSASGERVGQGRYGVKPSSMLMVNGILYMLVRNAGNASLMWSTDRGKTWEEADWKFEISFGCPVFLNYGANNEGAKDEYIYIYSHDESSAYKNSDHFVMARVPVGRIGDWRGYEFFAGTEKGNKPLWTDDIRKREAVFINPGKCYRSGITYNPGLKRYLWCQTIQLSPSEKFNDVRMKGGLGIFESSTPWGPWRTVYYTRDWDIGPGETSSIPVKWISRDGRIAYLLFSGDDYFSLRKITFKIN